MMKPWFQSCWVSRSLTTDSTRSSPTSSPAAMVRRTNAPILVWLCTFQRKMSPTLMCTMSRSAASSWLCVPLPLPCTPMITYLRISTALHTGFWSCSVMDGGPQAQLALAGPPHRAAEQRAQLRPVVVQAPRVDEPGQVVPPALAEHDAVQQQPGPLHGHVELAQPVPGQVDGQHDHPLPWTVQVIEPVRHPCGLGRPPGEHAHGRIIFAADGGRHQFPGSDTLVAWRTRGWPGRRDSLSRRGRCGGSLSSLAGWAGTCSWSCRSGACCGWGTGSSTARSPATG